MAGPSWKRFAQSYYAVNAGIIASFAVLRLTRETPPAGLVQASFTGLSTEAEALVSLAIFLGVQSLKASSTEAFFAAALGYLKTGVIIMSWYLDVRVLAWYLVLFGICYVVLPHPEFPWDASVREFSPPLMLPYVTEGGKMPPTLVFFCSPWVQSSVDLIPSFNALAQEHGGGENGLRFARVDVSRWPELAQRFGLDVSWSSHQIPSLLLLKNAKVVKQLPKPDETANPFTKPVLDKALMESTFISDVNGQADKKKK